MLLPTVRKWQASASKVPSFHLNREGQGTGINTLRLKNTQRKRAWVQGQHPGSQGLCDPSCDVSYNGCLSFIAGKTRNGRRARFGILRMKLMIKYKSLLLTRYNMNFPTQTNNPRLALRARCRSEEEERPVSTRGVWLTSGVQSDNNTMFLLFKLFYPIFFPAHKECTLVSTGTLCLCKLFWSKLSVNYFPNHHTTRSCWENGLCKNTVNCFCHRRKYNQ